MALQLYPIITYVVCLHTGPRELNSVYLCVYLVYVYNSILQRRRTYGVIQVPAEPDRNAVFAIYWTTTDYLYVGALQQIKNKINNSELCIIIIIIKKYYMGSSRRIIYNLFMCAFCSRWPSRDAQLAPEATSYVQAICI